MSPRTKKLIFLFLAYSLCFSYISLLCFADGYYIFTSSSRGIWDYITLVVFVIVAVLMGILLGRILIYKVLIFLLFLFSLLFFSILGQHIKTKLRLEGFRYKIHTIVENDNFITCCDSILSNWSLKSQIFSSQLYTDLPVPLCLMINHLAFKSKPHIILEKINTEVFLRLEFPNYAISTAMEKCPNLSLIGAKRIGRTYYTFSQRPYKSWQKKYRISSNINNK